MEFELLDNDEFPAHSLEAVRRYLQNPRRQMQSWGDKVPILAAFLVYGLVVVEWVLARRLADGRGRGLSAVTQVIGLGLAIFIAETILVNAAAGIAVISGKTGNRKTGLAYLSLGLAPLLLILPATLLCRAAGFPPTAAAVITLLLVAKVIVSWKDTIEIHFKLNRIQSMAAFYFAVGACVLLSLLAVYATVLAKIASVLG